MHPLLHGLIFGLLFWFFVGPALFALIQTSIQKGFKAAIFLALGISLSDVILVVLTLLGVSSFLGDEEFRYWMGVFGAATLIGYSIYSWMKKPPEYKEMAYEDSRFLIRYTLRGLVLNGLNPFLLFFWLSWISFVSVNYGYEGIDQRYFFTGLLINVFSSDVLKAYIAHRQKHLISPKAVWWMNKVVAVVLLLFSLRIIYFLVENYY